MLHKFLFTVVLLSVAASAQPAEHEAEHSTEWSQAWGAGFDEGSGGSAYMGIDIADVTPERMSTLKLKEDRGAEVTMVDEDAPAGKAGLREHDVITSLNGSTIESAAQLRRMIKETPAGRVVSLGISRDGQPMTIKVQLADRNKSGGWGDGHGINIKIPPISIPPMPDFEIPVSVIIAHTSMRSGLMVENLTPQLGDFFGVKDGSGALVRSVEKGSRGEKAGFHAGDVIVKINGQSVHDASDFTSALRGSHGATATVTVMREKREQTLTLPVPEKKDSGQLQEDSFEIPDVSEETQLAINNAEDELARLAPEIANMQADMQASAAQQAAETAAENAAEKAEEKSCRKAEMAVKKSMKKMQESIENQAGAWQNFKGFNWQQFNDSTGKWSEKLSHELAGDWDEI